MSQGEINPPLIPPPLEIAEHAAEGPKAHSTLARTLVVPSAAWVLYDTANTVYAASLTFLFFPYIGDMFRTRSIQGIVNSISMIVAGLGVPLFSSLADHTGRARLYLIVTTMACIGGLACFGLSDSVVLLMLAFFVANLGYNAALTFYNSLLPSVAADKHQGLVSGAGVGLGYIGTILIVVLLDLPESIGYDGTFGVAALMFFGLALPCFLLVRERRVNNRTAFSMALVRQQFVSLKATLKNLPRDRAVMWFLLGNFFCVDVLNTAIAFFGDFTKNTFFVKAGTAEIARWVPRSGTIELLGLAMNTPSTLLKYAGLTLNVLALLFGLVLGFLTDKWGSLRVLRLSAAFLALGLVGAAVGGGSNVLLYFAGICGFGGLGLAGIWTAGRKLLIELAPRDKLGEYFGLYGITVKLSVVGSAVFGIAVDGVTRATGDDLLGWKAALMLQALPLLLGLAFLARVKLRPAVSHTVAP